MQPKPGSNPPPPLGIVKPAPPANPPRLPDGGPAFPLPLGTANMPEPGSGFTGITARDYFASAALQGFLAQYGSTRPPDVGAVAREAYRFADAMLAEREKS